jgi:hypothetical protein
MSLVNDRTQYRVFLSYSRADGEFVRELHRRLTRDGVSCFLDSDSLRSGDNWIQALERAIYACEHIVFVLSPEFCNSEWAQRERTGALASGRKAHALMLRACDHLPQFPLLLRDIQQIDVSTDGAFEKNYPRLCEALGGVVRSEEEHHDRSSLPPVQQLPLRHRMPYRSLGDSFVGRVEPFWKLRDSLFRNSSTVLQGTAAIVGTGGLGKTQLAIEYAHRLGASYMAGVYWVDAELGLSSLITEIGIAAGIDLDTKADQRRQLEQLWQGLNRLHGAALLILDNFPENIPLQPWLPTTGRVHTLITTRRQDLRHPTVPIDTLTATEALKLLNSGDRQFDREIAEPLIERLGGLPLALELAKGYLNRRRRVGISDLLMHMDAAGELAMLRRFASEFGDVLPTGHELGHSSRIRKTGPSRHGRGGTGLSTLRFPATGSRLAGKERGGR